MLYHFVKGEGDLVMDSALVGLFSIHIRLGDISSVYSFKTLREKGE